MIRWLLASLLLIASPALAANPNACGTQTINLSAAQVAALDTVPVTLVAAPGPGKFLLLAMRPLVYQFIAGTTSYQLSPVPSDLVVFSGSLLGTDYWSQSVSTGMFTKTTNQVTALSVTNIATIDQYGVENQPIQLMTDGPFSFGTPTFSGLGNGTLAVTVSYCVQTLQ